MNQEIEDYELFYVEGEDWRTDDQEFRDDLAIDEALEREASCRICGCTENDCRQCVALTGARCHWVPDPEMKGDLCSACLPGLKVAK